ncbi:MAG TPA: hypothetical protein VMZ52_18035 [Bryobacteraceae bacterium]|nr:hypothetical protein [Bryobacteraceae bacterium]
MGKVQQRVLTAWAIFSLSAAGAPRFYPDDPLTVIPAPQRVEKAKKRKISEYYDYFYNTFGHPGERNKNGHVIDSREVNTLGEAPDSAWYTNRHAGKRMTIAELVRGTGNTTPPSPGGKWKVIAGKSEGVTPGLTIEDTRGNKYLLKFDPVTDPELATGADTIGAKFFYALGYNVPENYPITFDRAQLVIGEKAEFSDTKGRKRAMNAGDVDFLLTRVPANPDGSYRALASRFISGELLGPFRYNGTRRDDPNDTVPHELRRDLRGLFVFASWLNHTDAKSSNSMDALVDEGGLRYIRHYLIDFGAAFGSDSFMAKSPRNGNVYMFDWRTSAKEFFTFGLYTPKWMSADYPHIRGVGRLESGAFDPEKWHSNYENPAFENCLPVDAYWAAKKVMAFRDDEIRALVNTGQYSEPAAVDYLTKTLMARRDKIGRTWYSRVLPLEDFEVRENQLTFVDLAVANKYMPSRTYSWQWSTFDNATGRKEAIPAETSPHLPRSVQTAADGAYYAADIQAEDPAKRVTVYMRRKGAGYQIAGIDRTW